METKSRRVKLPTITERPLNCSWQKPQSCEDLEILIPLCCTTDPVRYMKFRQTLRGFSSKTLAIRLKELQNGSMLERQAYNEIPPRVEYKLTIKGQELVESLINLLHWMRRWSSNSKAAQDNTVQKLMLVLFYHQ
jgi:DNA-binding HxlR family transcriptional regulator